MNVLLKQRQPGVAVTERSQQLVADGDTTEPLSGRALETCRREPARKLTPPGAKPGEPPTAWRRYKRKGLAEMRPYIEGEAATHISVTEADRLNGSPRRGDMVARNFANHDDQWLVSRRYFEANFDPVDCPTARNDATVQDKLAEFAKDVLRTIEKGRSFFATPDDDEIMDLAVKHGLAVRERFDSHKHGAILDAEESSDVYAWNVAL